MHARPAPTKTQMQLMAEAAFAALPGQFREKMGDVVLQVEDFATPEQLASVDLDDRWHLSGLYEGEPLPDRSIWAIRRLSETSMTRKTSAATVRQMK